LIGNHGILILDEPTSKLDAENTELLIKHLEQSANRLTMIITHNLSLIRNADNILVLKAGKLENQGDYAKLMQDQAGTFYQLYTKQSSGYNDDC
jgi:ATP-binding cassette subfamily B protein